MKKGTNRLLEDRQPAQAEELNEPVQPARVLESVPLRKAGELRTLGRAVIASLLTLTAFLGAEGLLFHSGWYNKYLEPESKAGSIEYRLFWLGRARPHASPEVLVVGDSRIAEGFASRVASTAASGKLSFTNFGISGSSPRVWYYSLRDADPRRNKFRAIVLALDRYADEDAAEVQQNRAGDLGYVLGRLRVSDCLTFSSSFNAADLRRSALSTCFFRGIGLRPDLLSFFSDIQGRITRAKAWRNNGAGYADGYGGKPEKMTGLSVDFVRRTIDFPPGLDSAQTSSAISSVMPDPVPQTGAITRYRQQWIGAILNLYRNSSTRIILVQLPRAPWPIPDSTVPARYIDSIRTNSQVSILPAVTFKDLERPEFFADGFHLNQAGRPIFSERLSQKTAEVLKVSVRSGPS